MNWVRLLATRREYVHVGSYAASLLHRVAKSRTQFMQTHRYRVNRTAMNSHIVRQLLKIRPINP